ncbi:MAG: hypothetical protein VB861_02245 [Planctomycetaceae bacterium]
MADESADCLTVAAPGRPRRSIWLVEMAFVLLLVMYPLSYGPVMHQVSRGRWIDLWPVIDEIYAPIEWFGNSSEFSAVMLDWYLGLWGA